MGERDHKKLGVICEARLIKDQMSAEGIVAAAGEAACDLITMASHGRQGAARMLLGIQAQNVSTLGGRQKGGPFLVVSRRYPSCSSAGTADKRMSKIG